MPLFVEQLVFGLKICLSFRYHFFIGAKSLSLVHSFEVCKQPVVTGSDLENKADVEAIQSAIHVVLPSLHLTCDPVHCLGKTALFSLFVAVFWWFLPSNTPIMLYNIHYWWFFLSEGNWWTKYLAYPKIQKPKSCLLMFASLVALDSFHLLLSTQANCQFDSRMKWWIHVSSIVTYLCKNSFLLCWNSCKQPSELSIIVVFDWLWANASPTLNIAFSLANVHAKWWIHCLLISSTPPQFHTTSIHNQPKRVCGVFWCFWDNGRIWATWAFSIICVCSTVFKGSMPPHNHCF